MRNAKGTVRSYILEALKSGVVEKDILNALMTEKGLKPGNAKLHVKKAKAQFTVQAMTASTATKSRKSVQVAA